MVRLGGPERTEIIHSRPMVALVVLDVMPEFFRTTTIRAMGGQAGLRLRVGMVEKVAMVERLSKGRVCRVVKVGRVVMAPQTVVGMVVKAVQAARVMEMHLEAMAGQEGMLASLVAQVVRVVLAVTRLVVREGQEGLAGMELLAGVVVEVVRVDRQTQGTVVKVESAGLEEMTLRQVQEGRVVSVVVEALRLLE